jgi:hypothetical protein
MSDVDLKAVTAIKVEQINQNVSDLGKGSTYLFET